MIVSRQIIAAAAVSLPEPSAHMFPSDLERFETSETFAQAYSVAVGNPDERSVPVFTLSKLTEYATARESALVAERDALRAAAQMASSVLTDSALDLAEDHLAYCKGRYSEKYKPDRLKQAVIDRDAVLGAMAALLSALAAPAVEG